MVDTTKCPVCGETDPGTAWFCLPRAVGAATFGKPCAYSVGGHARLVDHMRDKFAERIRIPTNSNGKVSE